MTQKKQKLIGVKNVNVKLLAHTPNAQEIALIAIRTCYSANKPSQIVELEGDKYFGEGGKEGKRLFAHIVNSGHLSTFEHITFTFAIEDVSRALLAQLTRHRVGFSYSVQSQRYVKFGSADKIGGFNYVMPDSVIEEDEAYCLFDNLMEYLQEKYDELRQLGISAEDARAILPNATTTNLVLTVNLRSLLDFCSKRGEGTHAQSEIQELAERLKKEVVTVESWTKDYFI